MWITGFDVPSISTIYLDKPIKGHTLMQTIARANRVYDDEKETGLIVDYGNVYKQLEEAYSVYGEGKKDFSLDNKRPTRDVNQLSEELKNALNSITKYLMELGFKLDQLFNSSPLERLRLIQHAINCVCLNDTTRAKFEVNALNVINKFKALYPEEEARQFIRQYNAIDAIYGGLNQEIKQADITVLMKKLQDLVGENIEINKDIDKKEEVLIDLSKLNLEKLKSVFEKRLLNKIVYDLQKAIDKKLNRMMQNNPHRLNFYKKYLKIIQQYNEGKDADVVKKAFEELVKFVNEMNYEEKRSIRENLDEETLAIYDLLHKDNLTQKEVDEVKKIAKNTLEKLKNEKLKIKRWRESSQVSTQVKIIIRDCLLYLPKESYTDNEVDTKSISVYQHIYTSYYGGGLSIYNRS
jgi:type I restriction enzyme R subunit